MELLIALGGIVALDLVVFFIDSKGDHALLHHDQALDAIRHEDIDLYRQKIARMDHEIARGAWRTF